MARLWLDMFDRRWAISSRIAPSISAADIQRRHVLLGMNDQPELLGDDFDGAGIENVGARKLDLAGGVVALTALGIGQHGIGGGDLAEGFDRAAAIGMGDFGFAAVGPVNLVPRRTPLDSQHAIQINH